MQVRVCPEHALQLNYRKNREALKAQRKAQKRAQRKQQRDSTAEPSDSASAEKQSGGGLADKHRHSKRRKHREGDASAEVPSGRNSEGKRWTEDSTGVPEDAAGRVSRNASKSQDSRRISIGIAAEQGRADEAAEGSVKLTVNSRSNLDAEVDTFLNEMFP